jgi:RimJ/RimL family protein N-acetyltransferase
MNFNIWLRKIIVEDAELINGLRSVTANNLIGGNNNFISLDQDREWVKKLSLKDSAIDQIYLTICLSDQDQKIGYTSISNIDYRNKSAFWSGIKLIPSYTGKGYGFQVMLKILSYCFLELNMERVTAQSLEQHITANKYLTKGGFVSEGLMRHFLYKEGEYKNVYLWSILREEYDVMKKRYGI